MSTILRKLQREVFILSLRDPLSAAPQLDGFEVARLDDTEIEVAIEAGRDLNELFAALSAQGMSVQSLRNKANRLEELFLGLVDNKKQAGGDTAA